MAAITADAVSKARDVCAAETLAQEARVKALAALDGFKSQQRLWSRDRAVLMGGAQAEDRKSRRR